MRAGCWLEQGGRDLAAAVVWASAALSVPRAERAAHAPALLWLAAAAGSDADTVRRAMLAILERALVQPPA